MVRFPGWQRLAGGIMMTTKKVNHVSAAFQISAFLIASFFLMLIFYKPFISFKSYDIVPSVLPYNELSEKSMPIYTSFIIHNFIESEIIKNSISIDATISFAYNPEKVLRNQIEQFGFDEASTEKCQVSYHTYGNLEIATYDIQVKSKMDFNFKTYPLDDHRFWFRLKNSALPPEKYHFAILPNAFTLGERMTINNCMTQNVNAQVGVVKREVTLPDGIH